MKKIWVVKAGGELMNNPSVRTKILRDLKLISKSKAVLFVHGGGPQIEEALKKNGILNRFVNGRRVTSLSAIKIVEQVLSGEINKGISAELNKIGIKAVGLSGRDGKTVTGIPIPGLERAAKPQRVSTTLLMTLLKAGYLPVISSVGSDTQGQAVNINADDFASAIGIALKAENVFFLTNVPGVLDINKKRIPLLKTGRINSLISQGVISGGMIPKVQSARNAIQKGIGQITIGNGFKGISPKHGTIIKK